MPGKRKANADPESGEDEPQPAAAAVAAPAVGGAAASGAAAVAAADDASAPDMGAAIATETALGTEQYRHRGARMVTPSVVTAAGGGGRGPARVLVPVRVPILTAHVALRASAVNNPMGGDESDLYADSDLRASNAIVPYRPHTESAPATAAAADPKDAAAPAAGAAVPSSSPSGKPTARDRANAKKKADAAVAPDPKVYFAGVKHPAQARVWAVLEASVYPGLIQSGSNEALVPVLARLVTSYLAPVHLRSCWLPQFAPISAAPLPANASKYGGKPYTSAIAAGAKWPNCKGCDSPLRLWFQFRLDHAPLLAVATLRPALSKFLPPPPSPDDGPAASAASPPAVDANEFVRACGTPELLQFWKCVGDSKARAGSGDGDGCEDSEEQDHLCVRVIDISSDVDGCDNPRPNDWVDAELAASGKPNTDPPNKPPNPWVASMNGRAWSERGVLWWMRATDRPAYDQSERYGGPRNAREPQDEYVYDVYPGVKADKLSGFNTHCNGMAPPACEKCGRATEFVYQTSGDGVGKYLFNGYSWGDCGISAAFACPEHKKKPIWLYDE